MTPPDHPRALAAQLAPSLVLTDTPRLRPLRQASRPVGAGWVAMLSVVAAVIMVLALPGCGQASSAASAAQPASGTASGTASGAAATAVGVVTLQAQRVSLRTELPGRVGAAMVAEVRPQVRGLIRSRLFTEGALVKAGQPLYQIVPDSYRVVLASAEATAAKSQATVDAARLTAQRQAELLKIDAVSQQTHQDAQATLKQAEADLAVARAAVDTARLNLQYTTVTSPITGRVDVSTVTPGALVTADQTTALTTVRQLDPILVDVSQSSADLLRLKAKLASGKLQQPGAEEADVQLLLEDGSTYAHKGRLRFAGVSVNASTGAVTLRAVFPNPNGVLLPGMFVRAALQPGVVDQGIVLPQQAVQRDSRGGTSAWVIDADNRVQRRTVSVGDAVGNGWLVSSGLAAGERVVVEGQQKVRAGDTVQVYAAAPSLTPAASAPRVAAR